MRRYLEYLPVVADKDLFSESSSAPLKRVKAETLNPFSGVTRVKGRYIYAKYAPLGYCQRCERNDAPVNEHGLCLRCVCDTTPRIGLPTGDDQ